MALWGGRFEAGPDALFKAFNDSLVVDYRLVEQDIIGSMAWAAGIHRAGVLSAEELSALRRALEELLGAVRAEASLPLQPDGRGGGVEDVHSWVELRLIEKVGALGKKLHTGRSRNDQVATDFRLWVRDAIDTRVQELETAQRGLIALAERELGGAAHAPTVMPGYTHVQRAQPILFSHWCLAYVEMLRRDAERFVDARKRVNVCPLGSAALAGTTFAVDRAAIATELGFDAASANSLDATADRDFVLETLAAASVCAVHLSRLAEDLILFSSQEFGFVECGDEVSSGSSLMPQKKNPDALELIRGKCGRVNGAYVALATTMKGLPLAYNKDLQEDKELCFDAMDQLSLCVRMLERVTATLKVKRDVCKAAALGGHTNATELADYLVGKGVAFREAHEVVGRIVRHALAGGVRLEQVPLLDLKKFHDAIGEDVFAALSIEAGLARREVPGGTGPAAVRAAIEAARHRLA